jgi:hypothetical protein
VLTGAETSSRQHSSKKDVTTRNVYRSVMNFCENCGAIRGLRNIGCPAFYSRGAHSYVVGNKEMMCYYCNIHPGGMGTRCSGRMAGGSHDFRAFIVTTNTVHTKAV